MALRALVMDHGGVLTDGPSLFGLVRRARAAGFVTALATDSHVLPDDCVGLFDVVALGPALGARKPEPLLYERVAQRLGVAPAECVVVDDLARNLRGARAAGAVTVLHTDPAATVAELEILLGLDSAGC